MSKFNFKFSKLLHMSKGHICIRNYMNKVGMGHDYDLVKLYFLAVLIIALLTRRNPLLSPIGGKLEEEETSWGNHRLYMSMGEILLLNTDRKEAAAATAAAAAVVVTAAVWVAPLSLITHFQL